MFHAYILERNPLASVDTTHSWPRIAPRSERALDKRLRSIDPTYPRPSAITFLLFDDGQDSYQDDLLWGIFLKRVHDRFHNNYRVVLFCSHGSPSPRPVFHEAGTSLCLSVEARVVLWPTEISIGLLLTRLEFDEVVARYERKLNLHPIVLQRIFDWPAGHVGAVVQLLHVLAHQVSLLLKGHWSLGLLAIHSREVQKRGKVLSSQLMTFMQKIHFIHLFNNSG